jgi:hypothetical protein
MKHVIMFVNNENTIKMTGKEALSIGHDTMSGTGEVELGSFNEENRKLAQQSILYLQELKIPPANVLGFHRTMKSIYGDHDSMVEQLQTLTYLVLGGMKGQLRP